jgi:putative ABC transport system permease protein
MYAVVYSTLLRPLPFSHPESLVMVWEGGSRPGSSPDDPSPANFLDWQRQTSSLQQMSALVDRSFNLTGSGEPEQIHGASSSANFFSLLGVEPAMGRAFIPEEDKPGARAAIMSYGLWQRRFGGDKEIVGKSITVDGEDDIVVGVLPPTFRMGNAEYDLWTSPAITPVQAVDRRSHFLTVLGRLKPGVSLEQAQAELSGIAQRLAILYPAAGASSNVTLVPLHRQLVQDSKNSVLLLSGAAFLLLLIACVNVANLNLAHATSREREMAIRGALGAKRARLMRQLLTESILMAGCGAVLGIALARWSTGIWRAIVANTIPGAGDVQVSGNVLAFSIALCVFTAIVSGLAPAIQISNSDSDRSIRDGAKGSSGRRRRRTREALVISEIALAFVLLSGAGLLIRSFVRLQNVNTGFEADHLLSMRMTLPRTKYSDVSRRAAFYGQVLDKVAAVPGVRAASVVTFLPLTFGGGSMPITAEGQQIPANGQLPLAAYRQIGQDYFRAMGIPLKQGRSFESADMPPSALTVVVNETMAHRLWPNENPIGKRLKLAPPDSQAPWVSVVGVVGDVRQFELQSPATLELYVPYTRSANYFFAPRDLVVRTSGDPLALASSIRSLVWSVDGDQPVSDIRTMDQVESRVLAQPRFNTAMLTLFAALAVLLGSIGIFGVMAYSTAQRAQEIGIRIALGAQPAKVMLEVLNRGTRLALAGLCIGLFSSLALTGLMRDLLFDVQGNDPLTFACVSGLLLTVALAASYGPARRAMHVDPIVALRTE